MNDQIKELVLKSLIQEMDDGILAKIKAKREPAAIMVEETDVSPMESCELPEKVEEMVEEKPAEKLGMAMIKKSLGKRRMI